MKTDVIAGQQGPWVPPSVGKVMPLAWLCLCFAVPVIDACVAAEVPPAHRASTADTTDWSCEARRGAVQPARPLYLTFDTGHMGVAALVADILTRHRVPAAFFAANEKTLDGSGSLGSQWGQWWRARALEGQVLGSHTWDHAVWLADVPGGFKVKTTSGPMAGKVQVWSAARYCEDLERAASALAQHAGRPVSRLFRAPAGRTSPALLAAASSCGWTHVGWSERGWTGDELPSERYTNQQLLHLVLNRVMEGDVMLAHLGIWDRKTPWAPEVLHPLLQGLHEKGFCFESLSRHPHYKGKVHG